MLFMNDFDLEMARHRFNPSVTPNRARLVAIVNNLRMWADENSDGWAYWPKPGRAAERAMELIASTTNQENDRKAANDITDAQFNAAVRPIKAFLTRFKVDHMEVIQ